MLDFILKDAAQAVEPICLDGSQVTLVSEKPLSVSEPVRVKDADGHIATVTVSHLRRTDHGVWLAFATIQEGGLRVRIQWPGVIRREARLEVGLRVRSEALPGFAALSQDLSPNGLQLTSDSPLPVGHRLNLTLDLDDDLGPLQVNAVVRWTKITAPCYSGLLFTGMEAEQKRRLVEYLESRANPDRVVPRLSGSEDSAPVASQTGGTCLQITDGYRDRDDVILILRSQEECMTFRFRAAQVKTSAIDGQWISEIRNQPLGAEKSLYTFLGVDGATVFELEAAGEPEIVVSQPSAA